MADSGGGISMTGRNHHASDIKNLGGKKDRKRRKSANDAWDGGLPPARLMRQRRSENDDDR